MRKHPAQSGGQGHGTLELEAQTEEQSAELAMPDSEEAEVERASVIDTDEGHSKNQFERSHDEATVMTTNAAAHSPKVQIVAAGNDNCRGHDEAAPMFQSQPTSGNFALNLPPDFSQQFCTSTNVHPAVTTGSRKNFVLANKSQLGSTNRFSIQSHVNVQNLWRDRQVQENYRILQNRITTQGKHGSQMKLVAQKASQKLAQITHKPSEAEPHGHVLMANIGAFVGDINIQNTSPPYSLWEDTSRSPRGATAELEMNSSVSKVLKDLRLLGAKAQDAEQRKNTQSWAATEINARYLKGPTSPRQGEDQKKQKGQWAETKCDSLDVRSSSKHIRHAFASRTDASPLAAAQDTDEGLANSGQDEEHVRNTAGAQRASNRQSRSARRSPRNQRQQPRGHGLQHLYKSYQAPRAHLDGEKRASIKVQNQQNASTLSPVESGATADQMLRNAEKIFSSSNGNPCSGEEAVPRLASGHPLYLHSRSASREDQIQRNASTELGPRLPSIHKPGTNAERQAKVASACATQAGFFSHAKKRAAKYRIVATAKVEKPTTYRKDRYRAQPHFVRSPEFVASPRQEDAALKDFLQRSIQEPKDIDHFRNEQGPTGWADLTLPVHESIDLPIRSELYARRLSAHGRQNDGPRAPLEGDRRPKRLAPLKKMPGRATIAATGLDLRRRTGAHTAMGFHLLESLAEPGSKPTSPKKQGLREAPSNWHERFSIPLRASAQPNPRLAQALGATRLSLPQPDAGRKIASKIALRHMKKVVGAGAFAKKRRQAPGTQLMERTCTTQLNRLVESSVDNFGAGEADLPTLSVEYAVEDSVVRPELEELGPVLAAGAEGTPVDEALHPFNIVEGANAEELLFSDELGKRIMTASDDLRQEVGLEEPQHQDPQGAAATSPEHLKVEGHLGKLPGDQAVPKYQRKSKQAKPNMYDTNPLDDTKAMRDQVQDKKIEDERREPRMAAAMGNLEATAVEQWRNEDAKQLAKQTTHRGLKATRAAILPALRTLEEAYKLDKGQSSLLRNKERRLRDLNKTKAQKERGQRERNQGDGTEKHRYQVRTLEPTSKQKRRLQLRLSLPPRQSRSPRHRQDLQQSNTPGRPQSSEGVGEIINIKIVHGERLPSLRNQSMQSQRSRTHSYAAKIEQWQKTYSGRADSRATPSRNRYESRESKRSRRSNKQRSKPQEGAASPRYTVPLPREGQEDEEIEEPSYGGKYRPDPRFSSAPGTRRGVNGTPEDPGGHEATRKDPRQSQDSKIKVEHHEERATLKPRGKQEKQVKQKPTAGDPAADEAQKQTQRARGPRQTAQKQGKNAARAAKESPRKAKGQPIRSKPEKAKGKPDQATKSGVKKITNRLSKPPPEEPPERSPAKSGNEKQERKASPLARYYKLYVENKEKLLGDGAESQGRQFQHASDCKYRSGASQLGAKSQAQLSQLNFSTANFEAKLSPEREQAALELLRKNPSLHETYELASKGGDALTVLKSRVGDCDCRSRQIELIERRLKITKPIKEEPDGVNVGDGMSNFGEREEAARVKPRKVTREEKYARLSYFVSPCRRSCSTTHHPIFHGHRIQTVAPPRPSSADQIRALKKAELDKIDFYKTKLNEAITGEPCCKPKGKGRKGARKGKQKAKKEQEEVEQAEKGPVPIEAANDDLENVAEEPGSPERREEDGMLSDIEVAHYYLRVKKRELWQDLGERGKNQLVKRCWKTLSSLMSSMFLKKEYEIIRDADRAVKAAFEKLQPWQLPSKAEQREQEAERLMKLLIRCQRMHEAKEEVVRILLRVKKRQDLMEQFKAEISTCSAIRAKGYYFVLLKLSHQLFNQVERLRVDHPMLNKPFMYKDESLQTTVVREQMKLRKRVLKAFPQERRQLDRVLDKSGHIVQVLHLRELDKRMQLRLELESALTSSYLRIPGYTAGTKIEAYSPSDKDKGRTARIARGAELVQLESESGSPSPLRLRLMKSLRSDSGLSRDLEHDGQQLTREQIRSLKEK